MINIKVKVISTGVNENIMLPPAVPGGQIIPQNTNTYTITLRTVDGDNIGPMGSSVTLNVKDLGSIMPGQEGEITFTSTTAPALSQD